ncbi:MAG: TonB-dependent receptor [Pseudomonadota bacterium]|nr:TonB-dependent receptor [Pseudomonadota bacterium]
MAQNSAAADQNRVDALFAEPTEPEVIPVQPMRTDQVAEGKDDPTALDSIEVTGSRIQRDEFASSSPLSSFARTDIDLAGVVGVDEFLQQMPAFTGFQLTASTNNGGDGQKKVDLRGLGFNRNLVLINGRRQIGDVNGDGAVDLNTIPDALIERIEVQLDGSSTIYGSDALAGVTNIILKKNFDGLEISTDYGVGDEGEAINSGWSVLAGSTGGTGSVLGSLSYSKQEVMFQAEQPWATTSLYPQLQEDGTFRAIASGSTNSRRIRVDTDGDGVYESQRIVDAQTGQARDFDPATDTYNFAPANALITPNEHWQISLLGNKDVTGSISAYFEGLYTRRTSRQILAPDASFAVTEIATPNNGPQLNDFVPANNPFNPYGDSPRNDEGITGQDVRINRRFVESGGRVFVQGANTFRIAMGLEGDVFDTGILWDASYIHAQNETVNETQNYGRFDRWATAVDPVACQADAACAEAMGPDQTALNPFDDYGSISPSQMRYLTAGGLKDRLYGELNMLSVNFSGDLAVLPLPGGIIGWAAGVERRWESGTFSPDEFLSSGLTTGGANDPQEGSIGVDELYAEVLLPVLEELDVDFSLRHSNYDGSAGSATTYKLGLDYQVLESLRLRAGFGTGFRAPNISELNQGDQTGFPIVEPLCEFGDRRLAAGQMSQTAYDNCQTMGVDTTDAGEFGAAWQSAYTTTAPNQPLKPEESEMLTFGLVYTPDEFLPGASFGIDFWSIEIDNVIAAPDINDLASACINSEGLSSPACSAFSGGAPYEGPFPSDATAEFGNLGTLKTAGIDFNARYEARLDYGLIEKYHLSWGATYLDTYERSFALSGTRELKGTANGFAVFPDWRMNAEAGVRGVDWSAAYQLRYISETTDALRPSSITDDAVAEAVLYHDLVGSYEWQNIKLSGGINNLWDKEPPRFHSAFNANTEPGVYDVIGRRLFVGAKVTF